ncbi:MAG: transcription-repair coupling factor [Gammaproteobacteria bacterium]|nr:transcription-repair coupling factor [Gammaproteobacteria bacterium]
MNPFSPPIPQDSYQSQFWSDAHGSARSLAIAEAATKAAGPVLVICESNEGMEELRRELRYFIANDPALKLFSLPDWETLPYDNFSPHQDIVSDRLSALYHLPNLERGILVVSITSLMHKLPPKAYVLANTLKLKVGQKLVINELRAQLVAAGYQSVDAVYEHGEFAVRGSIIDLFPMGSRQPFRIDLWDDEIETLRLFNPETQLSEGKIPEVRLLPGREYPLDDAGVTRFRSAFRDRFDVDLRQAPLYQDVSDGLASPGLEYYLSLFFDGLNTVFDYLPETTTLCRLGRLKDAGDSFWHDIEARFEDRQFDRQRPILEPTEIFLPIDDLLREFKRFRQIEFRQDPSAYSLGSSPLPPLSSDTSLKMPFAALLQFLAERPEQRILFCAETAGRRETLIEVLKQIGLRPRQFEHWQDFVESDENLGIAIAPLDHGLWLEDEQLLLVTEAQLFGNRVAQRRRRRATQSNTDFIIKSLTELRLNDAVVHIDHGIGRYRGLETIVTDGQATEFLMLEYANEAKLYVPVASLELISRYSGGEEDGAPLNTLGTDSWAKAKRKAAEKIRDVAAELLDIYAQREAKKGFNYDTQAIDYDKFAASFPFEETADQETAIAAVLDDMAMPRAMDRLVCGDVGFGKTEVAMRAAFVAVQNNKQVALLVPTTLLAQQHYESLRDRFADWPVEVDVISRFKTTAEQNAVLERVAAGKVDILVGTHRLLNNEIKYADLGLLIIDEEHRFGVRQKEKLKALRADVDILTLTATPIPRTLNMSLAGIRDLSLIVTPPSKRLSVKTFVRETQDGLIKEAVSRELLRGGQVFYLHNEVKSIERTASHLQEIVPQARIGIAHGQMAERELEKVMTDFYHKRFNILLCTTIIETGIDIPSANTIVIDRADKFGLAQLHQLRGRVGRSHHQAYAYLLLPTQTKLTPDAQKRIDAIQSASDLGAGFTLASHDLEIRGAGELLGDEQSGHMQKIGFTLFTEMLEEAVAAIKDGRAPSVDLEPAKAVDINLRIPALIPDDYLPDVHIRLIMYKRISACKDADELRDLQVEMIDRFGMLPKPLQLLFRVTHIKLAAQGFGINKIDANASTGRLEFKQETKVDGLSLIELVQEQPQLFKFSGPSQLNFTHNAEVPDDKLDFIEALLARLRLNA